MTACTIRMHIARSLLLMVLTLVVFGCGMNSAYRPAVIKTIGDYSSGSRYQKKVGIVALLNNTMFTGDQVPLPFTAAFLERIQSAATKAVLVVPGSSNATPPFLWNPPRIANGEVDVFTISGLARQAGMNAVVSPVLMDIRVRQEDTGFWIFKDVAYSLQIQTAAAIYDAITGSRLALGILTDEVAIDEQDATMVRNGQEVMVDDLVEVAQEMGEELGERMGDAIDDSKWLAAVIAIQDATCVITAGREVGIAVGDRFDVLDGSQVLVGLDGQRYVVPGEKIGEITISRVSERQSYGQPTAGELPPAGSILIPNH